jgi:hypothetical protein
VIRSHFDQLKTISGTYEALHKLLQSPDHSVAYQRYRRSQNGNKNSFPSQTVEGKAFDRELEKAKKLVAEKEGITREIVIFTVWMLTNDRTAEHLNEVKYRAAGNLIECQCCFGDVPANRAITCDGDDIHLFCYSCVKKGAESQVGLMKYEMKCFDVSGCQAHFHRKLLRQVVGDKLMDKLDYYQQRDEIEKAGIEGLEDCPFCDFRAICSPVEEDKEFQCQNTDCKKISCRLCKEESHTPKSCEDAKKEKGISERHAVEEAMTQALVRTCPRCKIPIVKENGCNKVQCNCGAVICDVCKKDITGSGYTHFQERGGVCALHERDCGAHRQQDEVKRAGEAAIDQIVASNADLSREDLRVKDSVPVPKKRARVNGRWEREGGHPVRIAAPRPLNLDYINFAGGPQPIGVPAPINPLPIVNPYAQQFGLAPAWVMQPHFQLPPALPMPMPMPMPASPVAMHHHVRYDPGWAAANPNGPIAPDYTGAFDAFFLNDLAHQNF